MIELKEGDIYFWEYSSEYIEARIYSNGLSTLYWCCSQIATVRDGKLLDTYWCSGDNSKDVGNLLEKGCVKEENLTYVGNFSGLRKAQPYERAHYLDEDCINLNHANSSSGNFYIKKDAKKSLEKMKKVLHRKKQHISNEIRYLERQLGEVSRDLDTLNEESYFTVPDEVSLLDNHYTDEELDSDETVR